MVRPDIMTKYPDVDLKLGIKSSLPSVKATLALLMMIWRAMHSPAEVVYSKAIGETIEVADDVAERLTEKFRPYYSAVGISDEQFLERVNDNQLFKSQLESLSVAFELVWRVAKIKFVGRMASSFERTGGKRYPKYLMFTRNMDILDALLSSNDEEYSKVLLSWLSFTMTTRTESAASLEQLLVNLSEEAVYKLASGEHDIIFNMNSVYTKLLISSEGVDINDAHEAKGPLRILKSAMSDRMFPMLTYSTTNGVEVATGKADDLAAYRKRVDSYLSLTNAKHILSNEPEIITDDTDDTEEQAGQPVTPHAAKGKNIILYGVPGAGKSYTISEQYCRDEIRMERVVFHPDYTYSDFVGQILPNVAEGIVSYEFTPGPFTRLLEKAQKNPGEGYFLVVEEINRGNAPAIFGDVFQLLDRDEEGKSEYGISNSEIARFVYGDETRKVRIPSNMSIIGTMNTSDQNVFTIDTAFQRRWNMRMIENDLSKAPFSATRILDTEVTWRQFSSTINSIILKKNARATSSEDKRLGAFFIKATDLHFDSKEDDAGATPEEARNACVQNSLFAEKVLKYLWDDAFKFTRDDIFNTNEFASLEEVVRKFRLSRNNSRYNVFKEDIVTALLLSSPGAAL